MKGLTGHTEYGKRIDDLCKGDPLAQKLVDALMTVSHDADFVYGALDLVYDYEEDIEDLLDFILHGDEDGNAATYPSTLLHAALLKQAHHPERYNYHGILVYDELPDE